MIDSQYWMVYGPGYFGYKVRQEFVFLYAILNFYFTFVTYNVSEMVLTNYKMGWKEEFDRYPGMRLEYIPLDIAWKAAYYAGMREHYPHFFAKSGFFAFFVYDLDKFWVYDIFRNILVDNALDGCNVRRTTLIPDKLDDAIAMIREMVRCGSLIWMSWFEPILVYGFEEEKKGILLQWHNPAFAPEGTTWGRDELDEWWNWADYQEARLLIAPTGVVPGANREEDVVVELARLMVENADTSVIELENIEIKFGFAAYNAFASDLRNPDIDFRGGIGGDRKAERLAWFDFASYSQWSQLFAAHSYFAHVSHRFFDEKRKLLQNTSESFAKAYGHWLEWEAVIGRHPDNDVFISRIGDMESRIIAANKIDDARKEIEICVEILAEFLELNRNSPIK